MKRLTLLSSLLGFSAILSFSGDTLAFGIHKWVEKNGTTVYTDAPPEGQSTQTIELPEITIVETLPLEALPPLSTSSSDNDNANNNSTDQNTTSNTSQDNKPNYEVSVISPKNDESIRANDGNITAVFNVKPLLKKGESLVIYLDGKQKSIGENTQFRFENLDRGTHTLFAIVRDKEGNAIANSESTTFHVKRFSSLHNKKQPEEPEAQ